MNYKNGKIYCIRSNQTDDIYIGSTCTPLHKRFYQHRSNYKRWKNGTNKNYMTSYKILEYDDAYIELIEEFECNNRMELNRREGEVIREMDCVNKRIAGRTDKEYREDNINKKKEYLRKYREENRDKLNEYRKGYREENRDKLNEKKKIYRIKNKEKINEKIDCKCGGKYTHNHQSRHLKSKKHQLYLEKQQHLDTSCNLIQCPSKC